MSSGPGPDEQTAAFWSSRAWWRRAGAASASVWASTVLVFLGSVVAARALGPDEYGAVVLALATATLIATFLDLTILEGVVHHGFRALAADDISGVRGLLRGAVLFELANGVVVAALIVGLAGPIAAAAGGGELDAALIRLAGLSTLAMTADGITAAVLQLAGRADLQGWALAGLNLARLVATLAAVSIGGAEAVLAGYALATAVGGVAQAGLAWHVGWRRWRGPSPWGDALRSLRKLISFGVHSSVTTTLLSLGTSLIPVILGRMAGIGAVGLYRVAQLPAMIAAVATSPLRIVLYGEQCKLHASGRAEELRRVIWVWSAIGAAIALPAAIAGLFLMPWLIPALYGGQFAGAVATAQIMLIVAVFNFSLSWNKTFFAVIGRPQIRTAISSVWLLVAVPLTVLLASDMGSDGAAIAVAAATVIMALLHILAARRHFRRQRELARPPEADAVRAPESEPDAVPA